MNPNGNLPKLTSKNVTRQAGFTLLEVIIAASILGLGLLSIIQVFPYGIQASRRAEDMTKATLLAQILFEGLKTDPINYPIIPGAGSVLVPIPGNAFDDDEVNVMFNTQVSSNIRMQADLNNNWKPDSDFDGMPEQDGFPYPGITPNGVDDDGDGVIDDNGDSRSSSPRSIPSGFAAYAADGDFFYDPEPNIDEEYADGIDNDRDGLIDEDVRLASVRVLGSSFMLPLLAGDNIDNDGDGEKRNPNDVIAIADGIDNDDDGEIDEGIDEEIWDGRDNDNDGKIDEDCRLASFPISPSQFPQPNQRYSWQIFVGRIPDNGRFGFEDINGDGIPDLGDGIDNDGDGRVDEEIADGLDFDFPTSTGVVNFQAYTRRPSSDGLVDEDCVASPLPFWRRVEILITWGGDGVDNDGDSQSVDPGATAGIGMEDGSEYRSRSISYGNIRWGIDEEKQDGIDNDFDGLIDEDTYTLEYRLVGFLNLKDPNQSFTLISGQPRGLYLNP